MIGLLAASASQWMWLPFAGYFVAIAAAIWAVVRESAAGNVAPQEDHERDQ
jgi:hypothetical protein